MIAGVICCFRNFSGSIVRALNIVRFHGSHIEEKDDHPSVANLIGERLGGVWRRVEGTTSGAALSGPAASTFSMSAYEKFEIFCSLPLSVTVNCSWRNPLMGFPELSVTSTSMRTVSDCVRKTQDEEGKYGGG